MILDIVRSEIESESLYSTSMSMSLSALSSPLEQEPNNHAFFIGWVAKYCLIVFIVLVSIIIMRLFCKDTIFLSYWQQIARDFFILRQLTINAARGFNCQAQSRPFFQRTHHETCPI